MGPTATILSYDLYKFGYQVIDIGHIDIEYELYLRNASNMIPIPNKYVNEARKGNINIGNIKDENYYSQIIEISYSSDNPQIVPKISFLNNSLFNRII